MSSLKTRMDRLEKSLKSGTDTYVIVRRIVERGHEPPIESLRDYAGQVFSREAGEDEDGFIDRVARLVGYPSKTVALIAEG